jgi:hypothetical protein
MFLNLQSKSTSKIEPQKKRKTLIESSFFEFMIICEFYCVTGIVTLNKTLLSSLFF